MQNTFMKVKQDIAKTWVAHILNKKGPASPEEIFLAGFELARAMAANHVRRDLQLYTLIMDMGEEQAE